MLEKSLFVAPAAQIAVEKIRYQSVFFTLCPPIT